MSRYIQLSCKFTPEQYAHLEAVKNKYHFNSTYELVKMLISMLLSYTDYDCSIAIAKDMQRLFDTTLNHLQADIFQEDYRIIVGLNDKGQKKIKAIDRDRGVITLSQVRLLRLIIDTFFPALKAQIKLISNKDNYAKILADVLSEYITIMNGREIIGDFAMLSSNASISPPKRTRANTIYDEKK